MAKKIQLEAFISDVNDLIIKEKNVQSFERLLIPVKFNVKLDKK